MTDQTTAGFEAEPTDVQGLLEHLLGEVLDQPDWTVRYVALTKEQVRYDGLVSAIKRERGKALAHGRAAGQTLEQLASATGLSTRQRVQQILAAAGPVCSYSGCQKAATVVAGGLPYCTNREHVPEALRGTLG
jgi:hypothetical protein